MNTIFLRLLSFSLLFLFGSSAFGIGDSARIETNLVQAYQQYGLTGNGTIVAIIDRGIDYRHPDFIDANGNTRIAFIYDMLDNTGMNDPDNPYGVGTIYDMAEINQALSSGNELATMDYVGHGIATTGIAAGNGSAISADTYRGVAYEAQIIAVKAFTDALPPFGNFPGQAGAFNPAYLEIALQFVADKVTALNLPSVTLMNLGSTGGPTDGTSSVCRAMDNFAQPGRLLVCGVGDDGGGDNHASGTLVQGDTSAIVIQKMTTGNLRFDLWYAEDDRFDIMIETPDGTVFGPYTSPASSTAADDKFLTGVNYYHRGADVEFFDAQSHRREVLIDLTSGQGTFTISLIGASVSNGEFHATLNPGNYSTGNAFQTYVQTGFSINDYASAFDVIVPTDYVLDNQWTDINGTPRQRTGEGAKGDLWLGSSAGPTHDDRLGVDIAVPGEVLRTSYSEGTWYHFNSHNVIQDGNGFYGIQNAVSAAAPLLTGVLAMMLESYPTLSPADAKSILHQSARTDAFTGTTPNASWGYGKLDALVAIQLLATLSNDDPFETSLTLYPNPSNTQIQVVWENWDQKPFLLTVMNMRGQAVLEEQWRVGEGRLEIGHLPPAVYVLELRTGGHAIREKFMKVE